MRSPILVAAIISICTLTVGAVFAKGPAWMRDLKEAKESAKSDDKALFILFTGHGWCHACELVDREVFQQGEFVDATAEAYAFVELDYNFGDGPEEEKRKSELMQLRSRYLAPAVPTVVLADSHGRPYSFITGYKTGSGPKAYLDRLATAEEAKKKRDAFFSTAMSSSGASRAKLLDDALDCVAQALGDINERGEDPLFQFYGETIQEILELTGAKGTMAEKYLARRNRRTEWFSSESVFAKVKDFNTTKDYAGAINYIDSCLESPASDSIRWRLEYSRQVYLEWSDRNEEALTNCKRLLAIEGVPEKYHESLLDREAYNLFRLNRVAEGLAHYDRRITDAADDGQKRQRLLFWKAQMILGRDPVSRSISSWQAYRRETKRGTDDWRTATALLARELRRAKRHEDALRVLNEFLKEDRDAWLLLDAAESYMALENYGEARRHLNEAESANQTLADASRQSELEQHEQVVTRIDKLRRELPEGSLPSHTTEPE